MAPGDSRHGDSGHERDRRPGATELDRALAWGVVMAIGWFFAALLSGTTPITFQALTFLLWLATILAGTTCVLNLTVGLWKRQHSNG